MPLAFKVYEMQSIIKQDFTVSKYFWDQGILIMIIHLDPAWLRKEQTL